MRKIDQLAHERFDGDTEAAIAFLLLGDHGEAKYIFDQYVDELTVEEAKFAMKIVRRETWKTLMNKHDREILRMARLLEKMDMTQEQIIATHRNPYTLDVAKYACISLAAVLVVLAGAFFVRNKIDMAVMEVTAYLCVVVFLARTLPEFIKWHRFYTARRLAKKYASSLAPQPGTNASTDGEAAG